MKDAVQFLSPKLSTSFLEYCAEIVVLFSVNHLRKIQTALCFIKNFIYFETLAYEYLQNISHIELEWAIDVDAECWRGKLKLDIHNPNTTIVDLSTHIVLNDIHSIVSLLQGSRHSIDTTTMQQYVTCRYLPVTAHCAN